MNSKKLRYRYIFVDFIASLIVWVLIIVYRKTIYYGYLSSDISLYFPNFDYSTTLLSFPLICLFLHYLSGFYVNPIKESKLVVIATTFISSVIISFVMFFVLLLNDVVVDYTYYYKSLLVLFALLFTITYAFRLIQSVYDRNLYKKKIWAINTLIIGTGKNAQNIAKEIEKNSFFNKIVGFVKAEPYEKEVEENLIIGQLAHANRIIEKYDVKEAIIALDDADEHRIFEIINQLYRYEIDIQFTPRLYEILTGKVRIDKFGLNPLVSISRPTMSDWQLCVKRTADVTLSFLSLLLLSPLIIYFFVAIKADSKGPVIFKQERIGKHGKPFKMYKFRTMFHNAENGLPKLSSPNDERITKVGRVLRKYRLDEVPQFINIIKGEMSLVGPRPERIFYINQIIQQAPYYCLLYRIKPGLTSWGPIKIGYSDTIEKMVERLNFDIVYMENMSLSTDIKILFSTLEILFKGKGM